MQDVNAGDAEQRTPLHYACGFNHLQIAKMLIGEGAKLENTDSKGNTPLHYAAGYGRPQLVRHALPGLRPLIHFSRLAGKAGLQGARMHVCVSVCVCLQGF